MKISMILFMTLFVLGCKKNDPVVFEQPVPSEFPHVVVSQANYVESEIQFRVPDTTWMNKCCALYKNNLTESARKQVVADLLNTIHLLGQSSVVASDCLIATGQLKDSIISVPYYAERAQFESKECWIFEFAWGVHASDLGHYRCFVMDMSTKDTLLYMTCR